MYFCLLMVKMKIFDYLLQIAYLTLYQLNSLYSFFFFSILLGRYAQPLHRLIRMWEGGDVAQVCTKGKVWKWAVGLDLSVCF